MSSDRADELPNNQDLSWVNWNQGVWRIKATDFPDMVPALAMWAILSGKAVEIIGIGQLRYKESDRIQALMVNLDLLGIPYEPCDSDGLVIRPLAPWLVYSRRFVTPSELKGQRVATSPMLCCFGDHRMAMALSMLVLPDLSILMDAPQTVSKSYPRFWEDWAQFGYALKALN